MTSHSFTAGWIEVEGARTHNLKDVSVKIPKNALVAFTGVSGSGKSSLAMKTIHAIAQQWFLEGLTPFVRKFIASSGRPDVDAVRGMGPSLAVAQTSGHRGSRSTVGTVGGAIHPLRLLFSRLLTFRVGRPLTSATFDPHHADGQCTVCGGTGGELTPDEGLIVSKPHLSLLDGASSYAGKLRTRTGSTAELAAIPGLAKHFGAELELPWNELPEAFRDAFLYGTDNTIRAEISARTKGGGKYTFALESEYRGALREVQRLHGSAKTLRARERWERFFRKEACEACQGTGIGDVARTVLLAGASYADVAQRDVSELLEWLDRLEREVAGPEADIAALVLGDLRPRVRSLQQLGLGHIGLARTVPTLSGGELQRVRLSGQLGTGLTGVVYILDEPSSGLHPNDRDALLEVLFGLRDRGNTVILVEHDMELVAQCDWVVDLGPGAGTHGGQVIVCGPPSQVAACEASITGSYLRGQTSRTCSAQPPPDQWLTLEGLTRNNIKSVDVRFPANRVTCITGLSGSGKSSLLYAIAEEVNTSGTGGLDWVEVVTQAAIGRNHRSNPGTYTKLYDAIRRKFASTLDARQAGFDETTFSFNTKSGRCPECEGAGVLTVDMHYLPAVKTLCPSCRGARFLPDVLDVRWMGMSITEVLDTTVDDLRADEQIRKQGFASMLNAIHDVGLGYLKLGQPAPTLSGGEAQRLKLARLLATKRKRGHGLIVLDEPTTGLHPSDVRRILMALERLAAAGHTVILAEHNKLAWSCADWVIEVGPGSGPQGGRLMQAGPPSVLYQSTNQELS